MRYLFLLLMVTLTSCYTTHYIYDDPVYDTETVTETVYVEPEPVSTYYYDDFNPYYRFRIINIYYQQPYYGFNHGYYYNGYNNWNWNTCSHLYHSHYYNHGCTQYYGYYNNYGYHTHTYWCGHGYGNTCYNNNVYGNNWNGYYGHRRGSIGHFRTSKSSKLALINKEYKKSDKTVRAVKPVVEQTRTTPTREVREREFVPTRERQTIPTREVRERTPEYVKPNPNRNPNRNNQYKPQQRAPQQQRYQTPRQPSQKPRVQTPNRKPNRVKTTPNTKSNSRKRGG